MNVKKMTQDEALHVLLSLRDMWNADMTARVFAAVEASGLGEKWETVSRSWDSDAFWGALALLSMLPDVGIRLVEELREMAEPELER